jgi:hypothetical protein
MAAALPGQARLKRAQRYPLAVAPAAWRAKTPLSGVKLVAARPAEAAGQRRSTQARSLLAAVVSSTAAIRYAALKVSQSVEGCEAGKPPPLSRNAGVLTPPAQVGQGRRKKARPPTMVPGAVGLWLQATHPPVLALREQQRS